MAIENAPNQSHPGNREGSTASLTRTAGVVRGPNQAEPGDRRGGTMPTGGTTGVVAPPNAHPHPPGHSSDRG